VSDLHSASNTNDLPEAAAGSAASTSQAHGAFTTKAACPPPHSTSAPVDPITVSEQVAPPSGARGAAVVETVESGQTAPSAVMTEDTRSPGDGAAGNEDLATSSSTATLMEEHARATASISINDNAPTATTTTPTAPQAATPPSIIPSFTENRGAAGGGASEQAEEGTGHTTRDATCRPDEPMQSMEPPANDDQGGAPAGLGAACHKAAQAGIGPLERAGGGTSTTQATTAEQGGGSTAELSIDAEPRGVDAMVKGEAQQWGDAGGLGDPMPRTPMPMGPMGAIPSETPTTDLGGDTPMGADGMTPGGTLTPAAALAALDWMPAPTPLDSMETGGGGGMLDFDGLLPEADDDDDGAGAPLGMDVDPLHGLDVDAAASVASELLGLPLTGSCFSRSLASRECSHAPLGMPKRGRAVPWDATRRHNAPPLSPLSRSSPVRLADHPHLSVYCVACGAIPWCVSLQRSPSRREI
jgi:hypothetical protein